MPQTANFGFPLVADTPPEGMTGKDLRDKILGENSDSLARMVDSALQTVKSRAEDSVDTLAYQLYIRPALGLIELNSYEWGAYTEGVDNVLGLFYKISESTEYADTFKIFPATIHDSAITVDEKANIFGGLPLNARTDDLKDALGIVIYSLNLLGTSMPYVVVADRSGELPAEIVEQMLGVNPGANVPYQAGTYVLYEEQDADVTFVKRVIACASVKNYIDKLAQGAGT